MKSCLCLLAALFAASPLFAADYQEISWDDLMPSGWNPMKAISDLKLNKLKDSDPKAMEVMDKIKAMWSEAPTNPEIAGKAVRLQGFMVPLEFGKKEIKEFLLVPYFGACIHVPPPPANQIVHVVPDKPVPVTTGMDVVWVEGVIETVDSHTGLGDSGYHLQATKVEPDRQR